MVKELTQLDEPDNKHFLGVQQRLPDFLNGRCALKLELHNAVSLKGSL